VRSLGIVLVISGSVLLLGALWLWTGSMDLRRFSLATYLAVDLTSEAWHGSIGLVVLIGASLVIAGGLILRTAAKRPAA